VTPLPDVWVMSHFRTPRRPEPALRAGAVILAHGRRYRPGFSGAPRGPGWYVVTMVTVDRVQTGLRIERSTLKVLKGLAEYLDISLGDLVEGVALHAFEGKAPFSAETIGKIEQLKAVYGMTLTAADAHRLAER
jgi:hypothetical protein